MIWSRVVRRHVTVTCLPGSWQNRIRAWWFRNFHVRIRIIRAWLDGNRRFPW
jgi:hypothetical protein